MKESTELLRGADDHPVFTVRWRPEGDTPIKGVFQLCHGLAEHCLRYRRFAEALTSAGYAVIASDHRGHGRSVHSEDELGHMADVDGFSKVVADLAMVQDEALRIADGKPVILFGHSMGSTLALHLAVQRPEVPDVLVLSGVTGVVGPIRHAGALAARLEKRRIGPRGRSWLLDKMSFGDFNRHFKPARTSFDWLSRDPAEVDRYIDDPLCGRLSSAQLWIDLLAAVEIAGDVQALSRLPADLPVFVLVGAEDPVSNRAKQAEPLVDNLKKAGVKVARLKVYPDGRHELLNDVNRDEVTADILAFVGEVLTR